jgi:hypothetical protein
MDLSSRLDLASWGFPTPETSRRLFVSGVVINADTPLETVIALPPGSRGPQRVRCLPPSPREGRVGIIHNE